MKKWRNLKRHLQIEADSQAASDILDKMIAIAKAELENAVATIPLVEEDSRLGCAPEMGYRTDSKKIHWKVKQVKRVIKRGNPKVSSNDGAYTFLRMQENYKHDLFSWQRLRQDFSWRAFQ